MDFTRTFMKQVSYATGVRLLDVMGDEQLRTLAHELAERVRADDSRTTVEPPASSEPLTRTPEAAVSNNGDSPIQAGHQGAVIFSPGIAPTAQPPAPFDWSRLLPDVGEAAPTPPPPASKSRAVWDDDTEIVGKAWLPQEVAEVLAALRVAAPHQARAIEFALEHDGQVTREELYTLCNFPPDRQLKGFRRPVARASAALERGGFIREGLPELLLPWYENGGVASGYRLAPIAAPPTG